jgi:HD superfamily phosphohydrolase
MNSQDRLEFYDPLYETIIFERGLPTGGFNIKPDDPLDPKEIVQTAEFARLAYLNQVGLAWLVFPSATHTRFAHSIGCWWLGKIAESLIKVETGKGRVSLRRWLDINELREEFYLALLLHDVGHGPFSHVLERNESFVNALRSQGLHRFEHEHRGADLLVGDNALVAEWRNVALDRFGAAQTLVDLRERLQSLNNVCLPAIAYLMTGDAVYLSDCTHRHQDALLVVKELVSGLLDLDRLDHYARDSYFSGLRHVSINVRGFLTNLTVCPDANGPLISLTNDGAGYAAGLLFSKRQILNTMFRNEKTLALHAMINHALDVHLRHLPNDSSRERAALSIAWMQDHDLLNSLSLSDCQLTRAITQRIRAIQPFTCVGKWTRSELGVNLTRGELDAWLERHKKTGTILANWDDGFWKLGRPSESRDWLDSARLVTDNPKVPLTDHPDHRDDFTYLREANKIKYLWIFCSDDADATRLKTAVHELNPKIS